jgi:AraC-like DNA-binding protein
VRFLRAIRITKALELMAENKYTVSEIAMAVGYTSLSAFSNIFDRIVGVRPSEFMARALGV